MNIKSLSSHNTKEPGSSILYIVGPPIGNLSDISLRALNILKNVSLIACEDTRHTKILMQNFHITNHLISFNKHNSFKKIPFIIDKLKAGESVAIVSDAGLPSICDPGEDLVKAVKKKWIKCYLYPRSMCCINSLSFKWSPFLKIYISWFSSQK